MPCFRCSKCGCVENTALSHYWTREKKPALCSECDPEIGKWHGSFTKNQATGLLQDDSGFLWCDENVPQLPDHIKIVGRVKADGSLEKYVPKVP